MAGKIKYSFISLVFILTVKSACSGQGLSDTTLFKSLFIPEKNKKENSTFLKSSDSELKIIFSATFFFYKEFISSQDVDACVFTPSCSTYTMEAVQRKGILIGMLAGFDRAMRCHNNIKNGEYPFNQRTLKYEDPF